MIGKLKGLVDGYGDDHVMIDVQGVVYVVHCSSRTLGSLPSVGEATAVSVETFVREDMIRLFGFASDTERDWFRLLLTVQGVGTKVALAILSTLSASDLASAVALQDKAQVARAPGVGPKVAQRIVSELKDKIPSYTGMSPAEIGLQQDIGDKTAPQPVADAVSALVNLGYPQMQASAAIATVMQAEGEGADAAKLIRLGLKELAG
ncbi:MAG: Holliday junction branch migration protein RuvA [Pseudomonadota bacterium]